MIASVIRFTVVDPGTAAYLDYKDAEFSRYDYCSNIGTGNFDITCPARFQEDYHYFYPEYKDRDFSFRTYRDIVEDLKRDGCRIVKSSGEGLAGGLSVECLEP